MHSVDELFGVVAGYPDDDHRWSAIQALHAIGTREVFDRAVLLCRSPEGRARIAGADILGQLSEFSAEALEALAAMLDDANPVVVEAAVHALGQRQDPRAIDELSRAATHESANVRWAVANALEDLIADDRAEKMLLGLMRDDDSAVRDRATFAVGSLSDHDTPRIRAALAERLGDSDRCVASEAALGLARRRDARAIPYIATALVSPEHDIEEAAEEICAAEMLAELIKARDALNDSPGVDLLIRRCRKRIEIEN